MSKKLTKHPSTSQVYVTSSQTDVAVDTQEVETLVLLVLQAKKITCEEVSINFVSAEDISSMHQEFFNDPSPTDCISFPIDDIHDPLGCTVLGEIFVCPEVAIDYASKHKTDPSRELSLYVVHGLLHLMGLDDIEPHDRAKMRREERKLLSMLEEKHAYLSISRLK